MMWFFLFFLFFLEIFLYPTFQTTPTYTDVHIFTEYHFARQLTLSTFPQSFEMVSTGSGKRAFCPLAWKPRENYQEQNALYICMQQKRRAKIAAGIIILQNCTLCVEKDTSLRKRVYLGIYTYYFILNARLVYSEIRR